MSICFVGNFFFKTKKKVWSMWGVQKVIGTFFFLIKNYFERKNHANKRHVSFYKNVNFLTIRQSKRQAKWVLTLEPINNAQVIKLMHCKVVFYKWMINGFGKLNQKITCAALLRESNRRTSSIEKMYKKMYKKIKRIVEKIDKRMNLHSQIE